MEATLRRFRTLVLTMPSLTRTLHFLEKVVATKNFKYDPKQRQFTESNFFS
jgi:hypothetical protein